MDDVTLAAQQREKEEAAAELERDRPRREAEQTQTAAALSLLQRLPPQPQELEANIKALEKIAPHLERNLVPYITKPHKIQLDPDKNRFYIMCEYNCDGDAFRSPWSNQYFPKPDDEEKLYRPSERLRRLEETFNEVFDAYKTSYYEGGVSSVYLWDLDEGFAGAFLIRKELSKQQDLDKGVWDSTHVLEARELPNSNFTEYKLSSAVNVHIEVGDHKKSSGETDFAGLVTRQSEAKRDTRKKGGEDIHLLHVGRMIEEMEISIRQSLESFYVAKEQEVLDAVRSVDVLEPPLSQPRPGQPVADG